VIDHLQDTAEISVHLVIPEAENFEVTIDEMFVTPSVASGMRVEIVLTSVDLNNQTGPQADEIQNASIPRCLPPKVKSA
jgi:hypothetical protein